MEEKAVPKFWFPAKRYGWGWGLPNCWQGWTVTGVWVAVLIAGRLEIAHGTGAYILFTIVMAAILIVVCYLKGEKPRWRWGKD